MKGLIKYDLIQLSSSLKGGFIVLYLGIIAVISIFTTTGTTYAYMIVFLSAALGISAFSYEETYHWDRYMAALPVSTKNIVLARYISSFVLLLIGIVCAAVISLLTLWKNSAGVMTEEYVYSLLTCFMLAILYLDLLLPVMYRLGAEKGRIFMLAFCGIIIGGAFFAADYLLPYFDNTSSVKIILLCLLVTVLALPVSYLASVKIRMKKEF